MVIAISANQNDIGQENVRKIGNLNVRTRKKEVEVLSTNSEREINLEVIDGIIRHRL